jgi:hypothetical protein
LESDRGSDNEEDPVTLMEKFRNKTLQFEGCYLISTVFPEPFLYNRANKESAEKSEYIKINITQVLLTNDTVLKLAHSDAVMVFKYKNKNHLIQFTRGLQRFILSKHPRFLPASYNTHGLDLGSVLSKFTKDIIKYEFYVNQVPGRLWRCMAASSDPLCFILRYCNDNSVIQGENKVFLERFTLQVKTWPVYDVKNASEELVFKCYEDNTVMFLISSRATALLNSDNGRWIIPVYCPAKMKAHQNLVADEYTISTFITHVKKDAKRDYVYSVYYATQDVADSLPKGFKSKKTYYYKY